MIFAKFSGFVCRYFVKLVKSNLKSWVSPKETLPNRKDFPIGVDIKASLVKLKEECQETQQQHHHLPLLLSTYNLLIPFVLIRPSIIYYFTIMIKQ